MDISFISSSLFWGIIIILIGFSVILKGIFKIDLPVIRILLGVFLVYLGVTLLIKMSDKKGDSNITLFKKDRGILINDEKTEYDVIFGNSEILLNDSSLTGKSIKINTVFGKTILKISNKIPYKIKTNSAFAKSEIADEITSFFGTREFSSHNNITNSPYIQIESNVVFGKFELIEDNVISNW